MKLRVMAGFVTRSSLSFSTMPKIGAFGNPTKHMKRMEQRNEKRRKVQQLSKHVVTLSCESTAKDGVCDVYLVGTAHYTPESCREVQAIVSYLKPPVVFLELCSIRADTLQRKRVEKYSPRDLVKILKITHGNLWTTLTEWIYAENASQFGLGVSEFCVAYEEAKKYGGKVVLGDVPAQVSDNRAWRKMSLWQKILSLWNRLYNVDLSNQVGPLREVLMTERDMYMAHKLLEVARKNSSVVAVVGRAHLEGIQKYWEQPIAVEDLLTIPPSNFKLKCLGFVVAGVAIISSIYLSPMK